MANSAPQKQLSPEYLSVVSLCPELEAFCLSNAVFLINDGFFVFVYSRKIANPLAVMNKCIQLAFPPQKPIRTQRSCILPENLPPNLTWNTSGIPSIFSFWNVNTLSPKVRKQNQTKPQPNRHINKKRESDTSATQNAPDTKDTDKATSGLAKTRVRTQFLMTVTSLRRIKLEQYLTLIWWWTQQNTGCLFQSFHTKAWVCLTSDLYISLESVQGAFLKDVSPSFSF